MATPRAAEHRDLEQRFRAIEKTLRDLATAAGKRPQFKLESGDLTIDGGDVLMLDTDGSTLFRLGTQTHGDRGLTLSREDGSEALKLAKPFNSGDPQAVIVYDRDGNTVLSEEILGTGLGRPYLPISMQPVGGAATPGTFGWERGVTAGAFTDVFRWQGGRQNRWLSLVLNVRCSDTTTAAEVCVVDEAGTVLNGFFQPPWTGVVAAGSSADQEVAPPYGLSLAATFGTTQVLRVQARRTAGAGTVNVSVKQAEGGSA